MKFFYDIPLDLQRISKGGKLATCNIQKSIQNFVNLIVLTNVGEYRRDDNFGCEIWKEEFELLPLQPKGYNQIKNSIEQAIKVHEPRLEEVGVTIKTDETTLLMKKIEMIISGRIRLTGESFAYSRVFYLCPRSVE